MNEPIIALAEKHLDDALRRAANLDPKTDGEEIIASINVARGYLAQARAVARLAVGILRGPGSLTIIGGVGKP